MNAESRMSVQWTVLVAGALALLAAGAGAAYLGLRVRVGAGPVSLASGAATGATAQASDQTPARAVPSTPLPDVVVPLSREAATRAGLVVTRVTEDRSAAGGVRAPGVVEANAYRQVIVTPLIGGRLTRVSAELGQRVRRGETIAQLFSPELAEAQTRYISARAELEAHERELARTERLVQIGAASRQELEASHAEHTARRADLESVASRLQLLGLSTVAIEALAPGTTLGTTMNVPAPIDGVVTARLANVGLNVDPATPLFTVVDLSTVWVVVDVYEQDFARVRVGRPATITTRAYPNLILRGRVNYIDPQISAETRTVRVRIEVPNVRGALRLGMLVEALLGLEGRAPAPHIPRSAVQQVGDRTVVYLVNPAQDGGFIEREVRLGAGDGEVVEVLTGVRPGDAIVGEGSFYIRAERERLGLRVASGAGR